MNQFKTLFKIKTKYHLVILVASILVFSCDFEEKNINPNNSSTIEPGPLLTYSQLHASTDEGTCKRTQVGYCMMMVQQTASLERDEMAGDKYLKTETLGVFFTNSSYTTVVKNIQELINQTQGDTNLTNMYAVALIWKSFLCQRITDLYGDVPYSQACNGYRTQNFLPAYDRQEDIYAGLVSDIETALALFDESKPAITGDIIYNGSIEKWKRFGNSLLLRIGMRMEKVNGTLAKATVTKAFNRGVMKDVNDICMVVHNAAKSGTANPLSLVYQNHGLLNSGTIKISKTFMEQLVKTNDPRMLVYCALPDGNNTPGLQKGLPNGYDILNIKQGDPTYQSLADYSTFNRTTLLPLDAPTVFMTHAETVLLLAEAAVRGWLTGDARQYYEDAVRSSMKQLFIYGEEGIISDEQINTYLAQDLFGKATTTESKLNVIGTEFWIATFLNGYESYANWRRCGYPQLTPVWYSGSQDKGKIPRRFTYPTEEYSVNPDNVNQAVARQGTDNFETRIWWDKK